MKKSMGRWVPLLPILTAKEQQDLLKVKSLLSHLDYIIKPEHKKTVDRYHRLCRKLCGWR